MNRPFHFAVLNDTHYQDERCVPWLRSAFEQVRRNEEPLDFCLHLGDMADLGTRANLLRVRGLLEELELPVHHVIGNHDYDEDDDPAPYDALFPGRRSYTFEHRGWRFVGLDTTVGVLWEDTRIPDSTFAWLESAQPSFDREQPTVVFTHFPLGERVRFRPLNAEDLLARFGGWNVRHVFSGHYHALTERRVGETVLTTGRCCSFSKQNHDGAAEKGYLLCRAAGVNLDYRFVPVTG